jgi:hypothetical protein
VPQSAQGVTTDSRLGRIVAWLCVFLGYTLLEAAFAAGAVVSAHHRAATALRKARRTLSGYGLWLRMGWRLRWNRKACEACGKLLPVGSGAAHCDRCAAASLPAFRLKLAQKEAEHEVLRADFARVAIVGRQNLEQVHKLSRTLESAKACAVREGQERDAAIFQASAAAERAHNAERERDEADLRARNLGAELEAIGERLEKDGRAEFFVWQARRARRRLRAEKCTVRELRCACVNALNALADPDTAWTEAGADAREHLRRVLGERSFRPDRERIEEADRLLNPKRAKTEQTP